MLRTNVQNISNFFTETGDLSAGLGQVMDTVNEAVFGVEIMAKGGNEVADKILVTPPHIRLDEQVDTSYREDSVEGFTFYEGYLSKPFFLPLYGALNGEFLNDMDDLTEIIKEDEEIFIQWLFRRGFDWKERAIEMYASYLDGNDYPMTASTARKFQEKTLDALNKVSQFNVRRDHIDEAEEKILNDGFRFQLRIGIKSDRADELKSVLEQILQQYDSYNAIRLFYNRIKWDHLKQLINDCVITSDTLYQIVSKQEILSLFGGNVQESNSEEIQEETKQGTTNLINILPEYTREEVPIKEGLITTLAEALKRVDLIKIAKLYNESITAGIRLTVIQCDIPKGKTITHLEQKRKAIQAALGVPSIGIEQGDEPDTVKFTIPNDTPAIISLRELIESKDFKKFSKENPLSFIAGVDEINNPIYLSLSKLVHLLVAGTTGSGKSVFVNSLAVALIATYSPEELQMIMIDPKEVELTHYTGFPHVQEVITDMNDATIKLHNLTEEMDERYKKFKEAGVKNIRLYNKKSGTIMPYMVCIIDEYADLRDVNPKVEDFIARLGQKARASGIHMVLATQRPSADIVSTRIKAVIPNAISFYLKKSSDYMTVFGSGIPYKLLGKGDGVMHIEGSLKEFQRFQSSIISPDETIEEAVLEEMKSYCNGEKVIEPQKPKPEAPVEQVEPKPEVEEKRPKPVNGLEVQFNQEEDLLYKLKQILADTGETRVAPLRKLLGVKTTTMSELMNDLVQEGWLKKHESKAKGYEIIISESVLQEWRTN
jgi:S-DNA-T family DNA segregation ATPase FtsK/SpoIIIE